MNFDFSATPPLSEVIRKIEKSLVHIDTPTGSGSGFVIDRDGIIITNAHVVEDHPRVTVEFADGTKWSGQVLGKDEEIDLACIGVIAPRGLDPVDTGDSDEARVGQDVVVMGYPLGSVLKGGAYRYQGDHFRQAPGLSTDRRSHKPWQQRRAIGKCLWRSDRSKYLRNRSDWRSKCHGYRLRHLHQSRSRSPGIPQARRSGCEGEPRSGRERKPN